jgi:hypothetical protein
MNLSTKAIVELRLALTESVGVSLANQLSDEDIEEVGLFLLTALAEATKMQIQLKSTKNQVSSSRMPENSNIVVDTVG